MVVTAPEMTSAHTPASALAAAVAAAAVVGLEAAGPGTSFVVPEVCWVLVVGWKLEVKVALSPAAGADPASARAGFVAEAVSAGSSAGSSAAAAVLGSSARNAVAAAAATAGVESGAKADAGPAETVFGVSDDAAAATYSATDAALVANVPSAALADIAPAPDFHNAPGHSWRAASVAMAYGSSAADGPAAAASELAAPASAADAANPLEGPYTALAQASACRHSPHRIHYYPCYNMPIDSAPVIVAAVAPPLQNLRRIQNHPAPDSETRNVDAPAAAGSAAVAAAEDVLAGIPRTVAAVAGAVRCSLPAPEAAGRCGSWRQFHKTRFFEGAMARGRIMIERTLRVCVRDSKFEVVSCRVVSCRGGRLWSCTI